MSELQSIAHKVHYYLLDSFAVRVNLWGEVTCHFSYELYVFALSKQLGHVQNFVSNSLQREPGQADFKLVELDPRKV